MHQHGECKMHGDCEAGADFGAEIPKLTATVLGAALGSFAFPVGTVVGGAIGGLVDVVRHKWTKPAPVTTVKPPVARMTLAGIPPKPKVAVRPIVLAFPHVSPPAAQHVATLAAATPPPEASALYGYLKGHPFDGMLGDATYRSIQVHTLVAAFQSAYNSTAAAKTTGPLPTTGLYDAKTAAALVAFTHDDPSQWNPPFGPDPKA